MHVGDFQCNVRWSITIYIISYDWFIWWHIQKLRSIYDQNSFSENKQTTSTGKWKSKHTKFIIVTGRIFFCYFAMQALVIGVRKCGTRALLEMLYLHPRVQKAAGEVHFFDRDENYWKGLEWYRKKMPHSFRGQITIEKSPSYFVMPEVSQLYYHIHVTITVWWFGTCWIRGQLKYKDTIFIEIKTTQIWAPQNFGNIRPISPFLILIVPSELFFRVWDGANKGSHAKFLLTVPSRLKKWTDRNILSYQFFHNSAKFWAEITRANIRISSDFFVLGWRSRRDKFTRKIFSKLSLSFVYGARRKIVNFRIFRISAKLWVEITQAKTRICICRFLCVGVTFKEISVHTRNFSWPIALVREIWTVQVGEFSVFLHFDQSLSWNHAGDY